MSRPSSIVVGVGAERGLGAALCRHFAAEGYHVLVAGRTPARIEQGVRGEAAGGIAEAVQTDATREEDVRRSFDRGMAPGPGIAPVDLIVSTAGNNRRLDFRRETCRLSAAAPWRNGRDADAAPASSTGTSFYTEITCVTLGGGGG